MTRHNTHHSTPPKNCAGFQLPPCRHLRPALARRPESGLRRKRYSPTQEALLPRAAETAATAIEARKASKNRTHFEHCRAQGVFFQPLVVESFGGWDPVATTFLKKMATQEARRWGKTPAMEIKHFFQRLSIALQRGNAALLIARDIEPTFHR